MLVQSILSRCIFHLFRIACVMIFGLILSSWPATTGAQDVNSYTIIRAAGEITIDGRLDEGAWKNAREASLVETNSGKAVPLRSTVRLLWDDSYLYVGFYCEDPDAWAPIPGRTILYGKRRLWNCLSIPTATGITIMSTR